jgi:hypothetical protein
MSSELLEGLVVILALWSLVLIWGSCALYVIARHLENERRELIFEKRRILARIQRANHQRL